MFAAKSYQCPACGLAFCSACSAKRLPLPEITGTNEVLRVCNACYRSESSKLFAKQAEAKRQREESELVVRRREVMASLYWWYQTEEESGQVGESGEVGKTGETGEVIKHGPYDSEKMLSWYDHGYFQDSLIVWWCHNSDGRNGFRRAPSTIASLFLDPTTENSSKGGGKDAVFSLAFPDALEESYWVESVDPSTERKYYYNIKTEVSAWELPTVVSADAAAAAAALEDEVDEIIDDADRTYQYEDAGQWFYKDHGDVSQGPFHADDMRAWMDAGYFNTALYARMGGAGPFRLLQNIYYDLSLAFTYSPNDDPPTAAAAAAAAAAADVEVNVEIDVDVEVAAGDVEVDESSSSLEKKKEEKKEEERMLTLPAHARIRSLSAAAGGTLMSDGRGRSASRGFFGSALGKVMALEKRSRAASSATTNASAEIPLTTLRSGMLEKRGRLNRSWKKRYFVLDPISLSYFTKDPVHEKGKKKGTLSVVSIQSVHRYTMEGKSNKDITHKEWRLDVIAKDRKLILRGAF